jgi:uncharacterized protein
MPFVFRFTPVLLLFLGGQVYFPWRAAAFLRRRIRSRAWALTAGAALWAAYFLFFLLGVRSFRAPEPTHLTWRAALLEAPFLWWIFTSTLGFLMVLLVGLVRLTARGIRAAIARGTRQNDDAVSNPAAPVLPARRQFLEHVGTAAVAAPFVAGAYGLFWGRINLQVTPQPIRIAKLPRAFHGFRIAQLSDIHIGPFMSEGQITRYAQRANDLKPDLIALTGDFVTWDRDTQDAVVRALSCLKAPFGVFGCLGNHDTWADAEDSLTERFGQTGIRILRQQQVPIRSGNEWLNLIGIDFANSRHMSAGFGHLNADTLEGVEKLLSAETANILLSHNPETFDRAAALGIDLSLAGHTHGGQLALEFVSPEIAPSRIITPYVAGLFQQPGGQLYVNRGIGTIAAPMRVGAPPEITVFELLRA